MNYVDILASFVRRLFQLIKNRWRKLFRFDHFGPSNEGQSPTYVPPGLRMTSVQGKASVTFSQAGAMVLNPGACRQWRLQWQDRCRTLQRTMARVSSAKTEMVRALQLRHLPIWHSLLNRLGGQQFFRSAGGCTTGNAPPSFSHDAKASGSACSFRRLEEG